jgi:hypothetical protein
VSALATVVLPLEGVLAGRDDDIDLTTEGLNPLGHALYLGLARVSRLVLATKLDRRFVDHWCRVHFIAAHQAVTPLDSKLVQRLRAAGENLELYVDHDAERAANVLQQGVPTMLFTRPLYARAGHRPDLPQLQKPWAAIVAESRAQHVARAQPVTTLEED